MENRNAAIWPEAVSVLSVASETYGKEEKRSLGNIAGD
jgi:hypothetical protein